MGYINEAIDCPKYKCEGMSDFSDTMIKGNHVIAFDLKYDFNLVNKVASTCETIVRISGDRQILRVQQFAFWTIKSATQKL